ncbi:hypothetical protein FISHEDRAFT_74105 [Fistulina hepatica ATCC 64428]|uniref:3-beta hydroxysteroid dehydrogenase/isomerase domain-containing protein n=1 Tax=Fistulina hepatica ATCC 64428 TaxID=1128425 RepID=A0A0D7AAY3_9AGAR|nr:hypothetical protein FISHEDRAFT_74105 [Fistulina hepatica ATCC 64428]
MDPMPFWDVAGMIWSGLDQMFPGKRSRKNPFVLGRTIGLFFACIVEMISWLFGIVPTFTRGRVHYISLNWWFDAEKARRVLGYVPQYTTRQSIEKTLADWKEKNGHLIEAWAAQKKEK